MSSTVEPRETHRPLDELLVDVQRDPRELIAELHAARLASATDGALARELDRAELRLIGTACRTRRHGDALDEAVAGARRSSLANRRRSLLASPLAHPAVLFDLAELAADHRAAGLDGDADEIERDVRQRIAALPEVDEALREEARERYAALATQEEDLDLRHRVLVLRATRDVIEPLAERSGDRELQRLARRLGVQADDRVLAMRLERTLTRRGAVCLENTSLVLLLLVLVLLIVESSVALTTAQREWLLLVDATACAFFIGEFFFKLALAPARGSWFVRNALTDLLPAIPAVLWLVPAAPSTDDAVFVRLLRFFRITWFARYVQALRPILRLYRLLLFLVRGMDALVERFSALLNRDFVFFERDVEPLGDAPTDDVRGALFGALRREYALLGELPVAEAEPLLVQRAAGLGVRLAAAAPLPLGADAVRVSGNAREVPVEHAIEFLYRLRPEQVGRWLSRADLLALDRFVRVVNAPLIRSLPLVRQLRSSLVADTPEERVVGIGRRVAALLERWRERVLHVADMHGIVTGPQVLDRISSALVRASQRPAVRLLLFGALFWLAQLVLGAESWLGRVLERFVALPLVILGSVCLVFLAIGRWLKSLAGEASDTFRLTSEANFIGLLQLQKRRHQDGDLDFLGRRVFRWDMEPWHAAGLLSHALNVARTGLAQPGIAAPPGLEDEVHRVALLYLHFLDGAVLHESDIKTTEQLLANLSLENIRNSHLGYTRRERKQLKRLSLVEGSLFRGPYVWFRFITESVAVETAKRVTDYNRNCLTLSQLEVAGPAQRAAFAAWLRKRRSAERGRLDRLASPADARGEDLVYSTTEFNALDFLSVDEQRERHIERVFGRGVLNTMRRDRERAIREIFGTRPLHTLPRSRRTLNAYRFYRTRLSRGRVLLMPLFVLRLFARAFGMTFAKVATSVREILAPEAAAHARERGRAPFAVALRKIHRMKGPTLIEAMRQRVAFDPSYCGAPPGWSVDRDFERVAELERDMDFLRMRERDRAPLRRIARSNRRRVEELHLLVRRTPELVPHEPDPELRRSGERAVTIAYMTDRLCIRTLFRAERWREECLLRMADADTRLPARTLTRLCAWLWRGCRQHPIDAWLELHCQGAAGRRARRNLKRLWRAGDRELRCTVKAWLQLPAGLAPTERALAIAREIYGTRDDISRELAALRAVQSLSVLDVRNYRKLVFELGGYAREGEDPALAEALP